MTLIVKPFTFTANTKAKASEVNSDFDTMYTAFNGSTGEANVTYVTANDGLRVMRAGPNAGGTNGARTTLLTKTFALGVVAFGNQTYTFATDAVYGNPAFSAAPTPSGCMITTAGAIANIPFVWLSAITATTATLQWDRTLAGGLVNISITVSFYVTGNV